MMKRAISILLCCGVTLFNLACTQSPPRVNSTAASSSPEESTLAAEYQKPAPGKAYRVRPELSSVRIYAFRAGLAAQAGHNHVLSAPKFTGFLSLPDEITKARFDLVFRLDKLEVDSPELRSKSGTGFSTVLDVEAIAGTRAHMLGESNFQADRYPTVQVHSLQVFGELPKLMVKVQLSLHGQHRQFWLPLTVEVLSGEVTAQGSFVFLQSDFGVQPYSVLGGLLAVQDAVLVEFNMHATPM